MSLLKSESQCPDRASSAANLPISSPLIAPCPHPAPAITNPKIQIKFLYKAKIKEQLST